MDLQLPKTIVRELMLKRTPYGQQILLAQILGRVGESRTIAGTSVSSQGMRAWIDRPPRAAGRRASTSDAGLRELRSAGGYARWIAAGRYLAAWLEHLMDESET